MSADDWEEKWIQEILTRYRVPENRKREAKQLVIFINDDPNFSRGDLQSIMKQARILSLRDLYEGTNDELLQEELPIAKYNYVTLLRNQYYARKRFFKADPPFDPDVPDGPEGGHLAYRADPNPYAINLQ